MRIGFVPIDNRPVCYTLPKLIAEIDSDIELFMPERSYLGDLVKCADTDAILAWLESLKKMDAFVISLDTLAYGGLISSRRSPDTYEEILTRIERLKNILKGKKVYAFSSIMRISNNNINQEEKPYWDKWGKKIFEYSWNFHKNNCPRKSHDKECGRDFRVAYETAQLPRLAVQRGGAAENCFIPAVSDVPTEILEDYLQTRKRNFEINKVYLEWQKEGIFDTLIFSKDDCAEFGLNVQEANALKSLGATIKTGADEIPLSLLARAISGCVMIKPIFLEDAQKYLISNYEDIPIEECVKNQIELAGCEVGDGIELYVNNFVERQGEIVMKVPTEAFGGKWQKPLKPYAVADVRFANGSDNAFVNALFESGVGGKFLGYSAWNTSANTLGSLIFALKLTVLAKQKGTFNEKAFNKLMITRFLDDWAYQANVRQQLAEPDISLLTQQMAKYEQFILAKFPENCTIDYKFPWNRLFEVEVEFI